ncbi:MAG: TetR/AcrR family transcriptional regulator [Pseudomonadota bacterium]
MALDPSPTSSSTHGKREVWDLKWIREPLQTRSERTRSQLLDATMQLLEVEGVDGLTIANVAKTAGCSVGSFYHHFEDKRAAVYAVLDRAGKERVLTAEQGLLPERWEGVSLLDIVEGYIRFSLKMSKRNAGVMQARLRLCMEDPEIDKRVRETEREKRQLILNLMYTRADELPASNAEVRCLFVLDMLMAMIERRVFAIRASARQLGPRVSEEAFVQELIRMAAGYLELKLP